MILNSFLFANNSDKTLSDLQIIKNAVSNVDYLDQISGEVLQAVVAAYVDGLWWSHGKSSAVVTVWISLTCYTGVSLICALLGFLGALFLRQHKL
jgi:hypothetical protein